MYLPGEPSQCVLLNYNLSFQSSVHMYFCILTSFSSELSDSMYLKMDSFSFKAYSYLKVTVNTFYRRIETHINLLFQLEFSVS